MSQSTTMPDSAEERFIAAATAPLADNAEMQVRAMQELTEALSQVNPDDSRGAMDDATMRLANARRKPWRGIFYLFVALISPALLVPVFRDWVKLDVARAILFSMEDPFSFRPGIPFMQLDMENRPGLMKLNERKLPGLFGEFTPEQELLLFGDVSTRSERTRFKALADLDPENPDFYAEYVVSSAPVGTDGHLLPDFLTTADRLAPGNSWFRYYAASVMAQDAVDGRPPRLAGSPASKGPLYPVLNPAQLQETIRLLEEAASQPIYHCHYRDLIRRRLSVLPVGDDVLQRKFAREYVVMSCPHPFRAYRNLAKAVATRAHECAASGDAEAFRRMARAWDIFCLRVAGEADAGLEEMRYLEICIDIASGELANAAKTLHLEEETAHFSRLERTFKQRDAALRLRADDDGYLADHGGIEGGDLARTAMMVADPPALSEADLKPAREAEHEMLARFRSGDLCLLFFCLAIITALTRFRHGKLARRLSGSLVHVLSGRDYLWILGIGVFLPLLASGLVEQFTPCGGRAFSIWYSGPGDLLRALDMVVIIGALPLSLAGWRLGRRLGFLGWKPLMILPLLVSAMGFTAWIFDCAAGFRGHRFVTDSPHWPLWWWITAAVFVLLVPLCGLLARRDHALRWLTCCRATIPAMVSAILLMALMAPIHHALEKHHIRSESLTKVSADPPALNRYDHEVGRTMRQEILEILEAKP